MSILIVSDFADYHAAAVSWALQQTGFEFHQWEGLGYEGSRQACIELFPHIRVEVGGIPVNENVTVWMRRPLPFSFDPQMAVVDRRFVKNEAGRFSDCLWNAMEIGGARFINPQSAAWAINQKLRQLSLAARVGMHVPRTLMGNTPERIVQFMSREPGRQIYKGFLPHVWENNETGRTAFARTVEMPVPDGTMEHTLTYAPGIYQQMIVKSYDVRVMVMGDLIRAFAIRSDSLDWRIDAAYGRATLEETTIPKEVSNGIKSFMADAGVVFGAIDFAVDGEENWYFLEINESGQFLWLDDMLPEAGVFQDFLAFLTGANRDVFPAYRDFKFDYSAIPERVRERPGQVTVEC